eukprot:Amastigsp_a280_872.p3 type:complete len:133 gc:universal Amastigsp_a280_872:943-545(-)
MRAERAMYRDERAASSPMASVRPSRSMSSRTLAISAPASVSSATMSKSSAMLCPAAMRTSAESASRSACSSSISVKNPDSRNSRAGCSVISSARAKSAEVTVVLPVAGLSPAYTARMRSKTACVRGSSSQQT